MAAAARLALGLDFGTESVRALLVGLDGVERGSAVARYRHGQIIEALARRQGSAAARVRPAASGGLARIGRAKPCGRR